jgi:hypothetical protein
MPTGGIRARRIAHMQLPWQIVAVQSRLQIFGLPGVSGRNFENRRFAGIFAHLVGTVMAKWVEMCN